jgi:hypothetical protein
MTEAKKKAEELVDKYDNIFRCENVSGDASVQCVIICVDEILNEVPSKRYWDTYDDETPSAITYWVEVKEELNKM